MVFVPETIIDEHTVMVKLLYAAITEVTVVALLRPQVLTMHTNVVQMVIVSNQIIQYFREMLVVINVTRVHRC